MNPQATEAQQFTRHCLGALLTLLACIGTGLLGSLVMSLVVMLLSGSAFADSHDNEAYYVQKQDVQRGSLLLRTGQDGIYLAAPGVRTHVEMQVNGMLARVRVEQVFRNPNQAWVEGQYLFPLPNGAAVDHLLMHIGDRIIEGQIKPRAEAKQVYEQAKREGRKASLVSQQRPNMFSNEVANIGPGEEIRIEIQYQQRVDYRDRVFSLRYPLVVGPRYTPLASAAGNTAPAIPSAPVLPPEAGKTNPVSITIMLDPGMTLERIDSPYHPIRQQRYGRQYEITLASETVPADRDFELRWVPRASQAPQAALFVERQGDADHAMLMLMPPLVDDALLQAEAREVIYVIDTSGSMAGASIREARAALLLALRQLRPVDSFNIIEFNSSMHRLYPFAVPASTDNLRAAQDYVANLQANGGTEMKPALLAALEHGNDVEQRRLRQVVFITDGSVSNEEELFGIIQQRLGDSRLFTVGIGSAPNGYFMQRAAQFGRGTYTFIGKPDEVEEKIDGLLGKLSRPVLADLQVNWSGQGIPEQWPQRIPDLYAGEPLLLTVRMQRLQGAITVSGRRADEHWSQTLSVAQATPAEGVARRWARDKIASLMDSLQTGADTEQVKQAVTQLALQHHMVSRYTSLVAVDVTTTRPLDESLHHKKVPLNLPQGWQYDKVFGNLAQTATPATQMLYGAALLMLFGVLCLLLINWSFWRGRRPC